ncbi:MAG: UbiD family decarboxylase, partial [Candidatus Dormibacteraceae bacterium]
DAGRYITAGLCIVRDPSTRRQNVAIHRLQLLGPDRLGALILPRHTHLLHRRAEVRGQPLECAIVIGADPVTMLASQTDVPFGVDELEVAGALHGAPLQVTRCETVDIDVPAQAEIVLEGRILPGVREPEGPFGEFPRYYGPRSEKEVLEITAVTSRRDPVYHTIVPASREHLLLGAVPREASLLDGLRRRFPDVSAVHLTPGGTFRYHVVVALHPRVPGQARNVLLATLGEHVDLKHAVVVDPDVDVFSPEEVEWAIATRFQGDRDLVIVPGARAASLDPSASGGLGTKLGFDCTIPLDADSERYRRIEIPGLRDMRVEAYVDEAARLERSG